jgi:hypothetical protein
VPDVGFFLNNINIANSEILPKVQCVTSDLESRVLDKIAERFDGKSVYLVTRDEVKKNNEDVLELNELQRLESGLKVRGIKTKTISIEELQQIEKGANLLLMNINYSNPTSDILIKKHLAGEINCFPNPIFQKNSQKYFGGKTTVIDGDNKEKFLKLIQPKSRVDEKSINPTLNQIHKSITKIRDQHIPNIYHADIGIGEIVPILSNGLHSFGQLHTRIMKSGLKAPIKLRSIPFTPKTSIIHTEDGPLFHSFRFTFIRPTAYLKILQYLAQSYRFLQ